MNRLKSLREERGMKQSELGILLNVKDAAISKYESGKIPLTGDTLIRLSEIFGVSIDYILGISSMSIHNEQFSLSSDEQKLIEIYRCLNEDEKQVVLGKAIDLKLLGRPTKRKKDIG